jgi:hypothetical protein
MNSSAANPSGTRQVPFSAAGLGFRNGVRRAGGVQVEDQAGLGPGEPRRQNRGQRAVPVVGPV